ncbi:hypothetical protein VTN77DRAFT_590 [Rasamsonia byssochlamydoides]|uniref:uncharacterized protein n=1 Tax=Rasamsonia byssochlamydoides TaxID=89139 RepID=UPI0037422162
MSPSSGTTRSGPTCCVPWSPTAVGCIYVGNMTAFNALMGAFVVLMTISYAIAIAAHMVIGRKSDLPGPFHLGRWGWLMNVLYWVIVGGFTIFVRLWWLLRLHQNYEGPNYIPQIIEG